jgi:hypothetical protein
MEKSFIKKGNTHTTEYIDSETGELLDITHNTSYYLANTKEEFYLMYSSMVLILKGSTDVRMKLFASLLERYSQGQEFSMSKSLKEIMANECGCKPRSFDSAFTSLIKDNIIVKINTQLYKVNPRHVFQGSTTTRNQELKAIIELGCKSC